MDPMRYLRAAINRVITPMGYGIRPVKPSPWRAVHELPRAATVIDVGVGFGTPELYKAYPNAHLVLVDPVEESRDYVDTMLRRRRATWVPCALGGEEGEVTVNVETDNINQSSLLEKAEPTRISNRVEQRRVPVRRLDDVVAEHGFEAPFGLKVDTEGYELEVLKGSRQLLARCAFAILECSVRKRFKASYEFDDVICFMREHGLKVHSVLWSHPDRKGIVRYIDVAFVPRQDASRATPG